MTILDGQSHYVIKERVSCLVLGGVIPHLPRDLFLNLLKEKTSISNVSNYHKHFIFIGSIHFMISLTLNFIHIGV